VTGAMDFRRSSVWTRRSRSGPLAYDSLLDSPSLDRFTASDRRRCGGGGSTEILDTVCEERRSDGGLISSLRRFPPSTYL